MKLIPCLLACVLGLVACTTPPATKEVLVPVPVKCVTTVPERPDFATAKLSPTATDFQKVIAITTDWLLYKTYVPKLEAGLTACK